MKYNIFRHFLMLICVVFILDGCSHTSYLQSADEVVDEANSVSDETKEQTGSLFVQVAGAVRSPGVYELSKGARVYQAIEAAGGLKKAAYDKDLNQAECLTDGQKLYVPTRSEVSVSEASQPESGVQKSEGAVNINTAGAEELTTLTGIGETKAAAIIEYRTTNGSFSKPEDLMKVSGIGEGTYNKLKDHITV